MLHRFIVQRKLFICLLVFAIFSILYSVFFSSPVNAQQSTQSGILNQQQTNQYLQPPSVQLSPQSPIYANLIAMNLMHTASCILTGISPMYPCMELLQTKDIQGNIQTIPVLSQGLSGGVFGAVNRINLAMFTTPPLSTKEYVADVANGFGIVKEANAQAIPGGGNGVLSPIINLWQVSRNISYLVMIIIFVLIGLMVMFRRKLNPQTVISLQMALPGLIFGLIFITFSYFFAAFITDFAFIGTDLVGYYFQIAQPPNPNGSQPLSQTMSPQNMMTVYSRFVNSIDKDVLTQGADTVWNSIHGTPQNLLRILLAAVAYQMGSAIGAPIGAVASGGLGAGLGTLIPIPAIGTTVGGALGAAGGGAIGATVGGAAFALLVQTEPVAFLGFAVYLIVIVIVIYAMFRLLFQLIKNYISIIFLTISAPFHFLLASMPGKSDIAYSWTRNMLCNVLAFPAVIAVLYFVAYLLNSANQELQQVFYVSQNQNIVGTNVLPLFGNLNVVFLKTLLAIGALLAAPSVPDIVCRAIGKVGPYGGMIDKEISQARGGQRYINQTRGGFGQATDQVGKVWRGRDPRSLPDAGFASQWKGGWRPWKR